MAFNDKEKEIISWGLQNGKSQQEVEQAISKYRMGAVSQPQQPTQPTETKPSFLQRVSEDVSKAGKDITDTMESTEGSPLKRGTEMTATAFNVIPKVAYEAMPEPARKGLDFIGEQIGRGFELLTDKIASTKLISEVASLEQQGFINKEQNPTLYKVLDTLGTAKAGGEIAGDILLADQTSKVLQKGTDITKAGANKVKEGIVNTANEFSNSLDAITNKASTVPKSITDKITLNKIDPKTQTILKETPVEKLNKIIKQGEEALKDPRIKTPLEEAGLQAKQAVKLIKNDMSTIGAEKADLLAKVGTKKVPNIAVEQINKIKPFLQKKLTDAERVLVKKYLKELESLGKNPTMASVDSTIDKLQATLFEQKGGMAIPTSSRVQSFMNSSIGELNTKLKSAVDTALKSDAYSTINSSYATRIKLFNELNKSLGTEGLKGGSLVKRFFSPSDAGTKNIFKQIKDLYGIDLAQDATLAKFVMDTLGDTRASSMLELPPTTPLGVAGKVVEIVNKKLTSPKRVFSKAKEISQ